MSDGEKTGPPRSPDTYYVPSGYEHAQQTSNDDAELIVVKRALSGEHVHTWSKDTGVMCVSGVETTIVDGTEVRIPVMDNIERGTECALGDRKRFE